MFREVQKQQYREYQELLKRISELDLDETNRAVYFEQHKKINKILAGESIVFPISSMVISALKTRIDALEKSVVPESIQYKNTVSKAVQHIDDLMLYSSTEQTQSRRKKLDELRQSNNFTGLSAFVQTLKKDLEYRKLQELSKDVSMRGAGVQKLFEKLADLDAIKRQGWLKESEKISGKLDDNRVTIYKSKEVLESELAELKELNSGLTDLIKARESLASQDKSNPQIEELKKKIEESQEKIEDFLVRRHLMSTMTNCFFNAAALYNQLGNTADEKKMLQEANSPPDPRYRSVHLSELEDATRKLTAFVEDLTARVIAKEQKGKLFSPQSLSPPPPSSSSSTVILKGNKNKPGQSSS